MRRHLNFVVAIAVMQAFAVAYAFADDETSHTYKLGGPRDVTVNVREQRDSYRIETTMLPVRAFDAATNLQLNRLKASAYGIRGLAKFLGAAKDATLSLSGAQTEKSDVEQGYFHLTRVLPRSGVRLVHTPASKESGPDSRASPSERSEPAIVPADDDIASFLDRKADYLDTVAGLKRSFLEELKQKAPEKATEAAGAAEKVAIDDFDEAIADIEERADNACQILSKQVDADKLLLSAEAADVQAAISTTQKEIVSGLKAAVKRHENAAQKSKEAK